MTRDPFTSDLSGQLSAFSVRQVLELLAGSAKTGELRLRTTRGAGRILMAGGDIAYATTATGADTVEELDRLLLRYQSGGDGVRAGPDTIELALEEQVTDVLYEALEWDAGTFEFGARESVEGGAVHLASVERALDLVQARHADWSALRELIPANDTVYSLAPKLPEGMAEATFDGLRWRLLALIGDGGSVDFIGRELAVSEYRAARLLAELIEAGYVVPDTPEPAAGDESRVHRPDVFQQLAAESNPYEDDMRDLADDIEAPDIFAEDGEDDAFSYDSRPVDGSESLPDVHPRHEPVSFSAGDLTQEERDELIRNMGKGIFPS